MRRLEARDLHPAFGSEIVGFDPKAPFDEETCDVLRGLFDARYLLLFRDIDLTYEEQTHLGRVLIGKEAPDQWEAPDRPDTFYISNKRPASAAPFGRLQFHTDAMWSDGPFESLSLYGMVIEEPSIPTTFVSAARGWDVLPDALRTRVDGCDAVHTTGAVRRGDLSDVMLTTVDRVRSTTRPIAYRHPRTGRTLLYVCEQMTERVAGLPDGESENLLGDLFAHLYDPAGFLQHTWRPMDLVVWDNLAIQHARPNVLPDGPARTLRKVACPQITLEADEVPIPNAVAR